MFKFENSSNKKDYKLEKMFKNKKRLKFEKFRKTDQQNQNQREKPA
jgi:hypothetical protein